MEAPLMQIADCVAVFVPNKGTAPQSPCKYSANYRRGNLGLNKVAGLWRKSQIAWRFLCQTKERLRSRLASIRLTIAEEIWG